MSHSMETSNQDDSHTTSSPAKSLPKSAEHDATDGIPVDSWGIGKVDLRGIPLEIVPPKKPKKFK